MENTAPPLRVEYCIVIIVQLSIVLYNYTNKLVK